METLVTPTKTTYTRNEAVDEAIDVLSKLRALSKAADQRGEASTAQKLLAIHEDVLQVMTTELYEWADEPPTYGMSDEVAEMLNALG